MNKQDPSLDPSLNNDLGSFPARLQEVMGTQSARGFAQRIGLTEGTMRNLLKGGIPKLDTALRIASEANVSLEWLATGKGDKFSAASAKDDADDEFVYVNSYAVEASAGPGSEVGHELVQSRMAFRKDWITSQNINTAHLAIISAKGDSMEPTISDGDILLVDTYINVTETSSGARIQFGTPPGTTIPHDGIYIIRLDGHLVVKRLQLDMTGGLVINSDNPRYDSQKVDKEQLNDIVIAGKVVWVGKTVS